MKKKIKWPEQKIWKQKFQPGMTGAEHLKAVSNLMLNSKQQEKDERSLLKQAIELVEELSFEFHFILEDQIQDLKKRKSNEFDGVLACKIILRDDTKSFLKKVHP